MSYSNSALAKLRKQASKISSLVAALSIALSGCGSPSQNLADGLASSLDGEVSEKPAGQDIIPGKFVVTLDSDADPKEVIREHGIKPDFVYGAVMRGFAGTISDAARAGLLADRRVLEIEHDQVVKASELQANPTWGLDRIDQRALPLDASYGSVASGSSVTAYIIDTGILLCEIRTKAPDQIGSIPPGHFGSMAPG